MPKTSKPHQASPSTAIFDLREIAASFPDTADTMLIDTRLTDRTHASSRVFRVYRPVAAHYHSTCDEYLVVLSGRATFFLGDAPPFEVGPGQLVFFQQGTIHGTPAILEEPFVVLAVDTPRRDPGDVHFVNPADGNPDSFIQSKRLY
ncbi:cupin domain-containing protein [Granulicella sp. S190]|uniref:cupin domain-containing protein n=1 Tax=Granulicella sp. S190 TaxID=1747226 RepID=UPI00131B0134|nr:cupin domain-containing protein [Granulicella sp. S190]